MKFTLLLTLALFVQLAAFSQINEDNTVLVFSPQIGFPQGDAGKTNKVLLGGHFSVEKRISERMRMMYNFGGGIMPGKSYTTTSGYPDEYSAIRLIQVRVGAKYFITEGGLLVGVYAGGAQAMINNENKYGFTAAPVVGHEFGGFDVSLRYDYLKVKNTNVSTINFSVGYHF